MLAITTDSFAGYGLDRTFELASKAGLDGIEVVIRHKEFDTYNAGYLKELSEKYKLPIIALSTSVEMSAEKATRIVDLAEKIGAPIITLTPPDIFNFDYKKWVKNEMPNLRRKKKVKIAIVNPPVKMVFGIIPKHAFNDIYELKDVEDIAFDTSNVVGRSEPLLEIYSVLKQKIRHIHLSNAKSDQTHTLLANGNVPLESFLTRLARDQYKGALTLKINPHALGVGNDEKVLMNIENCKKFVAKFLRTE